MTSQLTNPFEVMIREILDSNDITITPSENALGLVASIGEVFSEQTIMGTERVFIQLYVQATIPDAPSDVDLGYTQSDVRVLEGVVLAEVTGDSEPPRYHGETLTRNKFSETISCDNLLTQYHRAFGDLLMKALPQDAWLEHATLMYNDRRPGANSAVMRGRLN